MIKDKITIVKGADRFPLLRLKSKKTGNYIDFTGITSIQVILENKDRTKFTLTNAVIPATKAQATKGIFTFTAGDIGAKGNNIVLAFNGSDTIQTIVNAWNSANPTNPVTHNSSNGLDIVPTSTVRLEGGYDTYTPVAIYGEPYQGKLLLTILEKETINLKSGVNQQIKVILDYGTNPGGRRNVGIFDNKLDVIGS